jgi:hypothetical protein
MGKNISLNGGDMWNARAAKPRKPAPPTPAPPTPHWWSEICACDSPRLTHGEHEPYCLVSRFRLRREPAHGWRRPANRRPGWFTHPERYPFHIHAAKVCSILAGHSRCSPAIVDFLANRRPGWFTHPELLSGHSRCSPALVDFLTMGFQEPPSVAATTTDPAAGYWDPGYY